LVILAHINDQISSGFRRRLKRENHVTITRYLTPRLITFLTHSKRDEVLRDLIETLEKEGKLQDKESYYQAILEREKIVSTGIGMGVALPHAKMEGYEDFFIAVGIQQKQGIEWNALDGNPVRLIFMIGGPTHKQTEYLHLLSQLTLAIKDEERRKKLLKAKTPEEIIALFEGW
jgi:PTS system nitrogen regulatory IIA component